MNFQSCFFQSHVSSEMPSNGNVPSGDTRTLTQHPPKKNRPRATRLRQQQLPAWQPILTSTTVILTIFIIGVVFMPIGVLLYMASSSVEEILINYDNCSIKHTCPYEIHLESPMQEPVFFYYGLDNFFQNHRRYMKSRSDKQLLGDLTETSGCDPYISNNGIKVAPCGAIAASMFNDTFKLTYFPSNGKPIEVPWTYEGIVWEVDRTKFRNPPVPEGQTLCEVFKLNNVTKPHSWGKHPCKLDLKNPSNNGFLHADFMVWMRTAALPDFRKPYRVLRTDDATTKQYFENGLPAGHYNLTVDSHYPVSAFSGKKSFIISTTSWAGGKNDFLGIAYITVGVICIVLSAVFLIIHKKFGHYLSEMALPVR